MKVVGAKVYLVEHHLLGRDPFRIEAIWSEMYDRSFRAEGGGPIVFAGISAIEQALWDIKARPWGFPVGTTPREPPVPGPGRGRGPDPKGPPPGPRGPGPL